MRTILLTSFLLLTTFFAKSQTKHDWKTVKGVEMYQLDKDCSEVKPRELNPKTLITVDSHQLVDIIKTAKLRNLDLLLEDECLIVRVQFAKYTGNFMVYPKQGALIDFNDMSAYYFVDNPKQLRDVMKQSVKK